MNKYVASESFVHFSIPQKIVHFRYIMIKMKKNPLFPSPTIHLSELAIFVDALEMVYLTTDKLKETQLELLYLRENRADDLFKEQALYVNSVAKGDIHVILSSGFHPEIMNTKEGLLTIHPTVKVFY